MTQTKAILLIAFGLLVLASSVFGLVLLNNRALGQREARLQKIEYRLDSMQLRVDRIAFAKEK